MLAWQWAVLGLVLGAAEIVVPGFVLLGFAIGALGMAALVWLGFAAALAVQVMVAAGLGLVAWFLLRKRLPHSAGDVRIIDRDINE